MANIFSDIRHAKRFSGAREDRPGSEKNPLRVTVQSEQRLQQIQAVCSQHGWNCQVSVDADAPEDTTALDRQLNPPRPVSAGKAPGRNEPCSCGSGRKYKQCCGA